MQMPHALSVNALAIELRIEAGTNLHITKLILLYTDEI
jgi:hypothetical protein